MSDGRRGRGLLLGVLALVIGLGAWWWLGNGGSEADSNGPAVEADDAKDSLRAKQPWQVRFDGLMSAERGSIAGTVADPDDRPIAGATVCAGLATPSLPRPRRTPPTCARSGHDGRYRIEGLYPVRYRIVASAPRHIPADYADPRGSDRIGLAAGQQLEGVDLVLRPGGVEVRGTVLDVTGGVVEGALVTLATPNRFPSSSIGATVRSDADGKFVLWAEPGRTHVRAVAEGYSTGAAQGVAPGMVLEIKLVPESVLVGKVVRAGTTEVLSGVRVTISYDWSPWSREYPDTVFTDDAGEFRFDGLAPRGYAPEVRTEELYGKAPKVQLGFAQVSEPVVIEAHPAVSVEGRIVIAGKGEGDEAPCPRGHVELEDTTSGSTRAAPTNAAGEVRILAVLPGTYAVEVACEGKVAAEEYPDVVVENAPLTGQRWEVREGLGLAGVVVDAAGSPVTGANVVAAPKVDDPRARKTYGADEADAAGAFEITGLVAGTYEVRPRHADHRVSEDPVTVELSADDQPDDLRLVLAAGGTIRGVVRDEHGAPVPGVSIDGEGPQGMYARNKDDGTFEVRGLKPGRYRVWAEGAWNEKLRAPDTTDDDVQGEQVRVADGEVSEVELVVEVRAGTISGRVVGPQGPVVDAFVDAGRQSDAAGASKSVTFLGGRRAKLTDQDGAFEITGLGPGRYTLLAQRRGGGGSARVQDVEVGSEVEITIEETGSVSGTVKLSDGSVPERFRASLSDPKVFASGFHQAPFRSRGRWTFEGVPPGSYVLEIKAPEGTAKRDVELATGQRLDGIDVVLTGRSTLRGRVVALATGEPLQGFRVSAGSAEGTVLSFGGGPEQRDKSNVSDAQGSFEVRNVPSGRIGLTVTPWDRELREKYDQAVIYRAVAPGDVDVGAIRVVEKRNDEDARGDLGFTTVQLATDQESENEPITVAMVRADGPAAPSGLEPGDVITAVDGQDVAGPNRYLYHSLVRVAPGTVVQLALKRGDTVSITATEK